MKLEEWRKLKGMSQTAVAEALMEFAARKFPDEKKRPISYRAVGAWEKGVLPRRYWIGIIDEYTGHKVRIEDFA